MKKTTKESMLLFAGDFFIHLGLVILLIFGIKTGEKELTAWLGFYLAMKVIITAILIFVSIDGFPEVEDSDGSVP